MKKRFVTLLTGAIATLALTSCGASNVEEFDFAGLGYRDYDYLALKSVMMNMQVGDKKAVDLRAYPVSYASSSVTFTSSNTKVATVDKKGNVKAVSQGVCDIVVTSKDKVFSNSVRVVVSKKSSSTGCATALNYISSVYEDEGYEAPTKVLRYEYSEELYYCEDVLDHGTQDYEAMGYNSKTGYFFVEGPSVYVKTQHGDPEVKEGKWIFYPINYGLATRLIHITPTVKNYFDINTANYNTPDDIIRDVTNSFFVSGEEIIDNLMKNYSGKDLFEEMASESGVKFYSVDNKSVYFSMSASDSGYVVEADDELNYFDIPAETSYDIAMDEELFNSAGKTLGMNLSYRMYYKLNDGKNWRRELNRSQKYDSDFEEYKYQDPSNNGFTLVDSLYDL